MKEPWKVDKSIPLALIVTVAGTLIAQATVALMWAAKMDQRMSYLEQRFVVVEANQTQFRVVTSQLALQTERAAVQLEMLNDYLAQVREHDRDAR